MFHNPYLQSSYRYPSSYYYAPSAYARAMEKERALAQERARASAYLRDQRYEDDDVYYPYWQMSPRERQYLQAQKLRQLEERRAEEAARRRFIEAKMRQKLQRDVWESPEVVRIIFLQILSTPGADLIHPFQDHRRIPHQSQIPLSSVRESEPIRDLSSCNVSSAIEPASPRTELPQQLAQPSESEPISRETQPVLENDLHVSPVLPSPVPSRDEAATTIQTHYRAHRSLQKIENLAAEFHKLKGAFSRPDVIDFIALDKIHSVFTSPSTSTPSQNLDLADHKAKLAYTSTNVGLHTYTESLSRLLVKLDSIESYGVQRVRDRRRSVVREVEREAAQLEQMWTDVWARYVDGESEEGEEVEVQSMILDDEDRNVVASLDTKDAPSPPKSSIPSQVDSIQTSSDETMLDVSMLPDFFEGALADTNRLDDVSREDIEPTGTDEINSMDEGTNSKDS